MLLPFASCVLENRLYFGGYPHRHEIQQLCQQGFTTIVNLTMKNEEDRIPHRYSCQDIENLELIRWSIPDHGVPIQKIKCYLPIIHIAQQLFRGKKVYIHCKGGHGRSSMIVACLLVYMFQLSPEQAIFQTSQSHHARIHMKNKWKHGLFPQNYIQRHFVHLFSHKTYI